MEIQLLKVCNEDLEQYKKDMQEAFQKGFEDVYGKTDETILPERDIDLSLSGENAAAYKAVVNGEIVGGAVVSINEETGHNYLELLYVKYGVQAKGIGYELWSRIEAMYPETKVWETCTPYFEKRNIHFYVNKCGFHIVEFQNERNSPPDEFDDFIGDGGDGMFIFQKRL